MQAILEQRLVDFPEALEAVEGCFDHFMKPFTGLESHHKQQKFFRENFGLQVSAITCDKVMHALSNKSCPFVDLISFHANDSDCAFILNT